MPMKKTSKERRANLPRICHVGGDFLLVYELKEDGGVIFVRTGTHSDLFE